MDGVAMGAKRGTMRGVCPFQKMCRTTQKMNFSGNVLNVKVRPQSSLHVQCTCTFSRTCELHVYGD